MFATAGLAALAVTQSMPLITPDQLPLPLQPSTFTPVSGAPGATPTTSLASSRAAIVPATCVPWPLQSVFLPLAKLTWPTRLRSGWAAIPESITYAFTFVTAPEPLPASVELVSASILSIPQGSVCATALATPSGTT